MRQIVSSSPDGAMGSKSTRMLFLSPARSQAVPVSSLQPWIVSPLPVSVMNLPFSPVHCRASTDMRRMSFRVFLISTFSWRISPFLSMTGRVFSTWPTSAFSAGSRFAFSFPFLFLPHCKELPVLLCARFSISPPPHRKDRP